MTSFTAHELNNAVIVVRKNEDRETIAHMFADDCGVVVLKSVASEVDHA